VESLVLIHGLASGPTAWTRVLPLFESRFQTFTPALDGHRSGRQLSDPRHFSVSHLADGLERDMDAEGIGRAHLVGNSLGGWLALELAARGRAVSVTCFAPAGGWQPKSAFERMLRLRFVLGYAACASAARVGREHRMWGSATKPLLKPLVHSVDHVTDDETFEIIRDVAGCQIVKAMAGNWRPPEMKPFGQIACPVRIVWCGSDRILWGVAPRSRFAQLVPHAEQLVLAGVGHVPMFDRPDLVAEQILDVVRAAPCDEACVR